MRKFIEMIWDSGAWIGIIVMVILLGLFGIFQSTSSYSDMRGDVRNISNSLLAWQNGTQLPDHYNVEYIKKSGIFHNPFCRSLREVKTKECKKSKAVSNGLLPCKICTP